MQLVADSKVRNTYHRRHKYRNEDGQQPQRKILADSVQQAPGDGKNLRAERRLPMLSSLLPGVTERLAL